jgi:hypothetical protein
MTIVITMGNADQVVQVSDRRLTANGRLVEDESNKGGLFICANARLVFGFAGLAKCGNFNTQEWLLQNLLNLSKPECDAKKILDRLMIKATTDFSAIPELVKCRPEDRRLSIMFSGYLYQHSPPLAVYAILTNFQDFETFRDDPKVWDCFRGIFWNEERPHSEDFSLVQRIGLWSEMKTADESALRLLLKQRKPSRAIVGKAVETVRIMADRPEALGTIGKQLSTIILPRDLNYPSISEYHSMTPKPTIYLTPMAIATSELQVAMADPEYTVTDDNGLPVALIPKVGRNELCPCGSGKKYKKCHGLSK